MCITVKLHIYFVLLLNFIGNCVVHTMHSKPNICGNWQAPSTITSRSVSVCICLMKYLSRSFTDIYLLFFALSLSLRRFSACCSAFLMINMQNNRLVASANIVCMEIKRDKKWHFTLNIFE